MMSGDSFTATQIQLLKARANKFLGFKQQDTLSSEHGILIEDIDLCLAFGLLKYGYDSKLPGDLSNSVFIPFNKCLTICMQNGVHRNKEFCEICDSISGLTKHSANCNDHPEVCPTCKSFFNLLEYHLLNCYTCDMHLCTKLKLKLLKYHSSVEGGLVELWSKIQQYVSHLFPPALTASPTSNSYYTILLNKSDACRYPSVFDSVPPTPPMSPGLIARGGNEKDKDYASTSQPGTYYNEEYLRDMNAFAMKFGDTLGMTAIPGYQNPYSGGGVAGYDPAGADSVFMSTEMNSLVNYSLSSLESRLKPTDGYGSVIMGEPRQLRQLAEHWMSQKKRSEPPGHSNRAFKTEMDGVILQGTNSGMNPVAGQYKKNEHWRKITYVGSGVAGKCYLAVDIKTEAQFAVKKIDMVKYQSEELTVWSELEHPNLVQLFGAMRIKHKIYIFSEFYAAGNVAEFIDDHRMLDQWLSLWFLQQLLDAVKYLSKKNILHEDIKADNIFLKPDSYKVGLGDFGLSRKGLCPPREKPVGGQHHWSPEKAKSTGHGFGADVWAANCTLIHMLSGEPPWKKRFSDLPFLHFKIANESPPIEDIPENLIEVIDLFIRRAWTLDPTERPSAEELLQDDCFKILYEGYEHTDPVFRSHMPVVEEEEMEFDSYVSETQLSIDAMLEGIEDKEMAVAYLNQLCATINDEGSVAESMGAAASAPSAAGSSAVLRKQLSMKVPPLESIVEEMDASIDQSEDSSLSSSQNHLLERRHMPAISPLMLPKQSPSPATLEKRQSWSRSNTSPSPSTQSDIASRRETFRKQETSPAIIISSTSNDEADGLVGEKDIFDLNPGTSGYQTGSYITDDGGGLSLSFQSANGNMSSSTDMTSSLMYETAQQWPGSSGAWNLDYLTSHSASHSAGLSPGLSAGLSPGLSAGLSPGLSAGLSPGLCHPVLNGYSNVMDPIPLKPDPNAAAVPLEEKFDLSSSLKNMRESLSSSMGYKEPRSILTIVNGLTQIDQSEVLVRGNETWREMVEQNIQKIKSWHIDGYTYYLESECQGSGQEVGLYDLVPREKTYVYIFPTKETSTWQVKDGRLQEQCHLP